MALTLGQNRWTGTNYFLPSMKVISEAQFVETPKLFHGNRWSPDAIRYYQSIEGDLNRLKASSCGLRYQYNETRDAFFPSLSPFPQLQISPYGNSESVNKMRPDLNFQSEIQGARSILILRMNARVEPNQLPIPSGYAIYSHYPVPIEWQMPENQELLILVPHGCISSLGVNPY